MEHEYYRGLPVQLEEMKHIQIKDIDPESVKEIEEIRIDKSRPVEDRIRSLIAQTGNPYVYKDCGMIVKVSFADNGKTLQSCLEDYLAAEILLNCR